MRRPSWIVLAPGKLKQLEPTILRVARRDPEDDCPWELVEGKKGYVAIIEDEPGSSGGPDERLAKALSESARKPVYVVTLDDDECPSTVQAFAAGESKGEVKATADDALVTLGFRFDWMYGGEKVALRLEAPMVKPKPGETMIWKWSVSQWQQMKRKDGGWYLLLEGVGAGTIDQIIGICGDADAEVRFLAATMLKYVGYYGLKMEKRLKPALAALEQLAGDRSKQVSATASKAHAELVECGEYEAVRAELPWIGNYNERNVKEALALFDEDRPTVHRYLYQWFSQGATRGLPKAAVAKLKQLAETDPRAKEVLDEL